MGIETIAALGVAALAANAIGSKISEGSAESDQQSALAKGSGQLAAYRPQLNSAMQQGLMNRSGAFQGANNVLASMYGTQNAQPPAGLTNNPMAQVFGQGVQPPAPNRQGPPNPTGAQLSSAMGSAQYPGAPAQVTPDPLAGRR